MPRTPRPPWASPTTQVDDPAMMELMVSSIFDSGYFSDIRVTHLENRQVLVQRSIPEQIDGVPGWFVNLVNLRPEGGDALITRGWQQVARVEVLSNPQFALAKLWDSTLGSLVWLLLCGLLSAVFGGWLLRRQLRPLDTMVRQAEAISQREFLSLPTLPRTPELKRVVLAMNQMVEKLKTLFAEEAARSEKLLSESYRDGLTGLANRRLLDEQLADQLRVAEQNGDGHLLMLQLNDLAGLNQRLGGQRTDALIGAVGELLKRLTQVPERRTWLAARNRGGEFSLLAPDLDTEDATRLAAEISATLENLRLTGDSDCMPVAHLGIVAFPPWRPGEPRSRRLNRRWPKPQHAAPRRLTTARQLAPTHTAPLAPLDRTMPLTRRRTTVFTTMMQCATPARCCVTVLARLLDPRAKRFCARSCHR